MFKKKKELNLNPFNGNIIVKQLNSKEVFKNLDINIGSNILIAELLNRKPGTQNNKSIEKGTIVFIKSDNLIRINDCIIVSEDNILTYIS